MILANLSTALFQNHISCNSRAGCFRYEKTSGSSPAGRGPKSTLESRFYGNAPQGGKNDRRGGASSDGRAERSGSKDPSATGSSSARPEAVERQKLPSPTGDVPQLSLMEQLKQPGPSLPGQPKWSLKPGDLPPDMARLDGGRLGALARGGGSLGVWMKKLDLGDFTPGLADLGISCTLPPCRNWCPVRTVADARLPPSGVHRPADIQHVSDAELRKLGFLPVARRKLRHAAERMVDL